MAKNNKLINKYRYLQTQVNDTVNATYSTIAIALYEGGMTYELIADVFRRSQEIWEQHHDNVTSMVIDCYNRTGIQMMTDKQYDWAVKKGLIEDATDVN